VVLLEISDLVVTMHTKCGVSKLVGVGRLAVQAVPVDLEAQFHGCGSGGRDEWANWIGGGCGEDERTNLDRRMRETEEQCVNVDNSRMKPKGHTYARLRRVLTQWRIEFAIGPYNGRD
jgi:hypothetical protein